MFFFFEREPAALCAFRFFSDALRFDAFFPDFFCAATAELHYSKLANAHARCSILTRRNAKTIEIDRHHHRVDHVFSRLDGLPTTNCEKNQKGKVPVVNSDAESASHETADAELWVSIAFAGVAGKVSLKFSVLSVELFRIGRRVALDRDVGPNF
jgi:hypothetical protein